MALVTLTIGEKSTTIESALLLELLIHGGRSVIDYGDLEMRMSDRQFGEASTPSERFRHEMLLTDEARRTTAWISGIDSTCRLHPNRFLGVVFELPADFKFDNPTPEDLAELDEKSVAPITQKPINPPCSCLWCRARRWMTF